MKRIATNVYQDDYRIDARVTVNGITRYRSFPLDTPLKTIKAWQEDARSAIRKTNPTRQDATLAFDVQTYKDLPRVKAMPSLNSRTRHLAWWQDRFGDRKRHTITVDEVRDALRELERDGKAPQTVNHFRTALISLWSALDGPSAYCPARDIPKAKSARRTVKALDTATVDAILAALPRPLSAVSVRIMVMAHTGLPPAILKMIQPGDVDLVAGTLRVPPRLKGDGVDGCVLPLTAAAVDAFKLWLSMGCSGDFHVESVNRAFKLACRKLGLPVTDKAKGTKGGLSVYWLRHSFLTRALVATNGNLEAVQALALHADRKTTQHYTREAVSPLLTAAMAQIDAPAPPGNLAESSSRVGETPMKTVH